MHRRSAERSTLGGLLYSHGPHGLIVRTRRHLGARTPSPGFRRRRCSDRSFLLSDCSASHLMPTCCVCCQRAAGRFRPFATTSSASGRSTTSSSCSPLPSSMPSASTTRRSSAGSLLSAQTPELRRVDSGRLDGSRDWGWLADRQLLLLSDDQLSEALARLSPEGMRPALAATRELLTIPSPEITALVREDPFRLRELLQAAARRPVRASRRSLGAGLHQR